MIAADISLVSLHHGSQYMKLCFLSLVYAKTVARETSFLDLFIIIINNYVAMNKNNSKLLKKQVGKKII